MCNSGSPTPLPLLHVWQPHRVAVFRALRLGDMLCAVPALRALRQALPAARITLIGLPWAREWMARQPDLVDDFLAFPGLDGMPEQTPDPAAWPFFLAAARARRFDLAIQMHGDGHLSNAVVAQLGARLNAGFASGPASGLFMPWPEHGPESQRLLQLMAFLGAPLDSAVPDVALRPEDDAAWADHAGVRALRPGHYLCLHPGARAPERRWPPALFAAVGDALAQETGLPVVLTGDASEAVLARQVAAAMRAPVVEAACGVPVGALAALIARSRLLVTNDTGASHLAAALRVPSVVVFRASDMDRWAPVDRTRHRAVWDPQGQHLHAVLAEARALLQRFTPALAP